MKISIMPRAKNIIQEQDSFEDIQPFTPPPRNLSMGSPLAQFLYFEDGSRRKLHKIVATKIETARVFWLCFKLAKVYSFKLDTGLIVRVDMPAGERRIWRSGITKDRKTYTKKCFLDLSSGVSIGMKRRSWRRFLQGFKSGKSFSRFSATWQVNVEKEWIIVSDEGSFYLSFEEFATVLSILKMEIGKQVEYER